MSPYSDANAARNAIRVAKMRNSMLSLWRVLHSSEALPKSNIIPNQRRFLCPCCRYSPGIPCVRVPSQNANPVSAICPRYYAAFTGAAEAVSTDGSERADLAESIEGYTIPHDYGTARHGIEWMCARDRRPVAFGEGLRFRYAYGVSPKDFKNASHFAPGSSILSACMR